MKQDRIIPDKTEIVVIDISGKIPKGINLSYDKILRITFNPCVEGFFKKPSQKIIIDVNGRPAPFEFYRKQEGEQRFDNYIDMLTTFANDNNITLINNLPQ